MNQRTQLVIEQVRNNLIEALKLTLWADTLLREEQKTQRKNREDELVLWADLRADVFSAEDCLRTARTTARETLASKR